MDKIREFSRALIQRMLSGEITDREKFQAEKMRLCKTYSLDEVPRNSDILAHADDNERNIVLPILLKKPMRTASGVAVVAVMTSPHPCPHGKCIYCPGGSESPQSYTGKEPAARRASRNLYDPYLQVTDRIRQLSDIGHKTDKIDLIIMGGTFTCRDIDYQEEFVKGCFDGMNGFVSKTLEEAQSYNEQSDHRCVGLTVETRPDVFDETQIKTALKLGATRVELGVQILDDDILKSVNRGHGTDAVARCTEECKKAGLKVCYHVMPGLPNSSPEKDFKSFEKMFSDPSYKPDMLKFYTTLVIEGTELYDMWKLGEYVPYDTDTAVKLLAHMKSIVPEYVRIQRIQRDIPAPQIAAGITKSNLRQLVEKEMKASGTKCKCIRCREVGHAIANDNEEMSIKDMEYEASDGIEHFIQYVTGDRLIGYVRLRLDGNLASIRELKVFGGMESFGESGTHWQHRGYGKELVAEAEAIATKSGASTIRVTSGVGVRRYYASLGYEKLGTYMTKIISQ